MSRNILLQKNSVADYFKEKALKEGWVKEKQIEKKASSDFTPTDNFDENISKLILGLKQAGMNDLSKELTDKFLAYKKAEANLYQVTKDEYKKMIDKAHPKGSVKLDNVAKGDSLVEDIFDTQKALMSLLKSKKKIKVAQNHNDDDPNTASLKKELDNQKNFFKANINNSIGYLRNLNKPVGSLESIYDKITSITSSENSIKEYKNLFNLYNIQFWEQIDKNDEHQKKTFLKFRNSVYYNLEKIKDINNKLMDNTSLTEEQKQEKDKQKKIKLIMSFFQPLYNNLAHIDRIASYYDDEDRMPLDKFRRNFSGEIQELGKEINVEMDYNNIDSQLKDQNLISKQQSLLLRSNQVIDDWSV